MNTLIMKKKTFKDCLPLEIILDNLLIIYVRIKVNFGISVFQKNEIEKQKCLFLFLGFV